MLLQRLSTLAYTDVSIRRKGRKEEKIMNPNHPHGQMLAQTHYTQMPHVSAWLAHAVSPTPGFNSQVPTVMPLEGYKTSPPQTPMTNNMNVYRGAFRGGGAAV